MCVDVQDLLAAGGEVGSRVFVRPDVPKVIFGVFHPSLERFGCCSREPYTDLNGAEYEESIQHAECPRLCTALGRDGSDGGTCCARLGVNTLEIGKSCRSTPVGSVGRWGQQSELGLAFESKSRSTVVRASTSLHCTESATTTWCGVSRASIR